MISSSDTHDRFNRDAVDAIVIGAGPAGALCALLLARRGHSVVLLDREQFPRWKVCGCCLNGSGLHALREAGLDATALTNPSLYPSDVRIACGSARLALPLGEGIIVGRDVLDAALAREAVAAGAQFFQGTHASIGAATPDSREVIVKYGEVTNTIRARVVVCATGLAMMTIPYARISYRKHPASRIGAGVVVPTTPDWVPRGSIMMHVGRGGYVGMVRLVDGRLNIAAALNPGHVREAGSLPNAAGSILQSCGVAMPEGMWEGAWRGTPALTVAPSRLAAQRIFFLGDSAGYVEPFTGEGMAWALASALEVQPILAASIQAWSDHRVARWERGRSRQLASRQRLCRVVAALLGSPTLTGAALCAGSFAPSFLHQIVRRINHRPVYTEPVSA